MKSKTKKRKVFRRKKLKFIATTTLSVSENPVSDIKKYELDKHAEDCCDLCGMEEALLKGKAAYNTKSDNAYGFSEMF